MKEEKGGGGGKIQIEMYDAHRSCTLPMIQCVKTGDVEIANTKFVRKRKYATEKLLGQLHTRNYQEGGKGSQHGQV